MISELMCIRCMALELNEMNKIIGQKPLYVDVAQHREGSDVGDLCNYNFCSCHNLNFISMHTNPLMEPKIFTSSTLCSNSSTWGMSPLTSGISSYHYKKDGFLPRLIFVVNLW